MPLFHVALPLIGSLAARHYHLHAIKRFRRSKVETTAVSIQGFPICDYLPFKIACLKKVDKFNAVSGQKISASIAYS